MSKTVPASQSTNSMRPGWSSHQRTRSSGLSLMLALLGYLRREESAILRARADSAAPPAVQEDSVVPDSYTEAGTPWRLPGINRLVLLAGTTASVGASLR